MYCSTKLATINTQKSDLNDKFMNISINMDTINKFFELWNQFVSLDYLTKVIAIVGATNRGKTTFLNALLSFMFNYQSTPFERADIQDRIRVLTSKNELVYQSKTTGLDGFVIQSAGTKENYLFIDVVGLFGPDSEQDQIVMLFCYAISDIIIFNSSADLNNETLQMFNFITDKTDMYLEIAKNRKPHGIFRIFDSRALNDAQIHSNYLALMQQRNDSHMLIRNYFQTLFNWIDHPCIWSLTPDHDKLIKFHNDNNLIEFMNTTKNYRKSCAELTNILIKLEGRKRNIQEDCLKAAEIINKEFAKNDINRIGIQLDEPMRQWMTQLQRNGRYAELLEPIICKDVSRETYVVFQNRRQKIADCKDEFKRLFENKPNYNYGYDWLIRHIEPNFNNAQITLNNHISIISGKIKATLIDKSYVTFDNNSITTLNSSWYDPFQYNKIVEDTIGDIDYEIRMQIITSFDKQYKILDNKFKFYREKFMESVISTFERCKNEIDQEKKKCLHILLTYKERYELTFDEIVDLLINELQIKHSLLVDYDLAKRCNKYIDEKELKERKTDGLGVGQRTYVIVVPSRFKLIRDNDDNLDIQELETKATQEFDISNIHTGISARFEELRQTYNGQKKEFYKLRKQSLLQYLNELNSGQLETRIEEFERIKHNDLYMFNFDENYQDKAFELFKSIPENSFIYIAETFNTKFCSKVRHFYRACYSENELERRYALQSIWRIWSDDYIDKKYKSL